MEQASQLEETLLGQPLVCHLRYIFILTLFIPFTSERLVILKKA
jgi:hypothetical protein